MKNNKQTYKITPLKVFLIILIASVVIIAGITLYNYVLRDRYYECTNYEIIKKVGTKEGVIDYTENELSSFEYYRIYLINDKDFVLKFKTKENDKEETREGGYKKEINKDTKVEKLILTYDKYLEEYDDCTYIIEDDKLVREETFNNFDTGVRGTCKQTFIKK